MTWRVCLGILALIQSVVIHAVWTPAPSTAFATETSPASTPTTTSPPFIYNDTSHEPAQLCGYVDYNPLNSYTCGSSHTCFWNTALHLVGCGHATSINYITSCIPYKAISYCDSSCAANPSIIRCDAQHPYCVTPRMGPRGNYSILACEKNKPYATAPYRVHLTYSGQSTTGYLPRWLAEDGSVSYGTRPPKNGNTSTSGSDADETGELPGFDVVVSTISAGPTSNSAAGGNEGKGLDRVFIIGIVLGAGMLVAAVSVFVILVLVYRQRKQKSNKEVELRDMGSDEHTAQVLESI